MNDNWDTGDIFLFTIFPELKLSCVAWQQTMSHCECSVHFNTDECTFFLHLFFHGPSVGGVLPGGEGHHGFVNQSVADFPSLRLPGEEMFLVTHVATTAGNMKWTWTHNPFTGHL